MHITFPIEEAVNKRSSVRNYSEEAIKPLIRKQMETFSANLSNPFNTKVNFHYLDLAANERPQKLGTYGVIKGAKQFIGITTKSGPLSLEAVGYELEAVMLYLAHLGIGTCWLGGTFDRKQFAKAMDIENDEIFPAITPFGYAAEHKHLTELAMRKMIKADQRKDWHRLFFCDTFETPLTNAEAADFAFPLEMVRLGPSASNKQSWRIVVQGSACHFFEFKEPGYSKVFPYDIQRMDLGIAAAHFDFAVQEKGIKGHFDLQAKPDIMLPEHVEYVFSWIRDK